MMYYFLTTSFFGRGKTFYQAHPFWEVGTAVEISSSTPDVIVPTEAEMNSAVQVRMCR